MNDYNEREKKKIEHVLEYAKNYAEPGASVHGTNAYGCYAAALGLLRSKKMPTQTNHTMRPSPKTNQALRLPPALREPG